MNKSAQTGVRGFAFLVTGFIFFLAVFAVIEPFKESLDETRGTSSLNCPGTPTFDQTDYNNDTDFEKLVRRPVCFTTGISMVYYVGSCLIAITVWIFVNWRKTK